jgi:hypothetical protein
MTIAQEIPKFLPMMGQEVRVYYCGITKLCINCYQPGHIKKNCNNSTVDWIDFVQKFKEEHDFSDKLYGNWIKILSLNQVRKKRKVKRMSETREKATSEDKEETLDPEEENSTIELREEKLSR